MTNDPDHIAIDTTKGRIYVTQASNNVLHVINAERLNDERLNDGSQNMSYPVINASSVNSKEDIESVPTDGNPRGVAINPNNHMIYVANMLSGTVSILNGSSDKVEVNSVLSFKINPLNAGEISCAENSKNQLPDNLIKVSNNYSMHKQGTELLCISEPNPGYSFSSWSADVPLNIVRDIPSVSEAAAVQLLNSSFDNSNIKNDPSKKFVIFTVSKSGTLNANFVTSAPIPTEFWTPFYAIIPAIIGSIFIPGIIRRNKEEKQSKRLKEFYDTRIDDILKFRNPKERDDLEKEITDSYKEGSIKDSDYKDLKGKLKDFKSDPP